MKEELGTVMTIDNIFAILLLPFLGVLSDRNPYAPGSQAGRISW